MATSDLIITNKIKISTNKTSLRTAALVAGIGLLIMAIAAPFAEMYVLPKLIVSGNAAETAKNIFENRTLFSSAILGYLITFLCDILVAWALYVFLKPVQEDLSLLTAWFRLLYTVIAIVALLNLVNVLKLLDSANTLQAFQQDALFAQVMFLLNTFRSDWNLGLLFFGIHLLLVGYLAFRSNYIPKVIGGLVFLAGLGYLASSLRPFFPAINVDFAQYTFFGELIFMLWLLIKGWRIKESDGV